MKILFKKHIGKVLIPAIILNNLSAFSYANNLSLDTRYETFKGSDMKITDILEEKPVDIEVKGNTLVNMFREQGTKTTTLINNGTRARMFDHVYIKPNKTYTLSVNIQNLSTSVTSKLKMSYKVLNSSGELIDFYPTVHYTKEIVREGIMSITFTAGSAHSEGSFRLYVDAMGGTSHGGITTPFSFDMSECMLLEGDWSNKELPKYFEGLKSVGETNNNSTNLDLISENKNLFKNELYPRVNGVITEFNDNGDIRIYNTSNKTWGYQYFTFDAKPNTKYTFSIEDIEVISGSAHINIYEARNGELYGDISYGSFSKAGKATFTTSNYIGKDNIKVVFSLYSTLDTSVQGNVIYKGIQIEEANVNSDYSKYSHNIADLNLKEPLRSLPNGVYDKIVKKNGQWFVERNCGEVTLTEESLRTVSKNYGEKYLKRIEFHPEFFKGIKIENWVSTMSPEAVFEAASWMVHADNQVNYWTWFHSVQGTFHIVIPTDTSAEEAKARVLGTKVVYQLENPIYEPITKPSVNLYEDTTYISSNSLIPTVLMTTVDRVLNRAVEAIEIAKINPTVENLSLARMWTNLADDSAKKDILQNEISNIVSVENITLEKKKVSANLDLYIKSENTLSLSLDTNSVTFNDYSGVEDLEMTQAVNLTVNSSLPYSLNAYMPTGFYNQDKSKSLDINTLNIKESTSSKYQQFANTTDKIVLKDNCNEGNNNSHSIDLKLGSNNAHKADVYKTVIKFEVEQK